MGKNKPRRKKKLNLAMREEEAKGRYDDAIGREGGLAGGLLFVNPLFFLVL